MFSTLPLPILSLAPLQEVGYQHGRTYFAGMLKGGRTVESIYHLSTCLDAYGGDACEQEHQGNFIDLAEIIAAKTKARSAEGGRCFWPWDFFLFITFTHFGFAHIYLLRAIYMPKGPSTFAKNIPTRDLQRNCLF